MVSLQINLYFEVTPYVISASQSQNIYSVREHV